MTFYVIIANNFYINFNKKKREINQKYNICISTFVVVVVVVKYNYDLMSVVSTFSFDVFVCS